MEKCVNLFAKIMCVLSEGNLSAFSDVHLLDPQFYLQNIPLVIPVPQVFIIAVGTVLLSLLVSVIPAVKAGKEKPIDTLRKI